MDKDTAVILRNKKDSKRIRQCRVVFSYKQDHEDELNLNVGDIIEVLGEEEEGWWRGVLNGKIGVFPSNFVEEILADKLKNSREDLNVPNDGDSNFTLPPKPAKILCEVKYSYKAQNEDELSIKEGDVVTLISKDGQDPGWWMGELNGIIGVFPDNFVVILPHNHEKTEKSPSHDPHAIRPSSIASQRKSLDNKLQNHSEKVDGLAQGDIKSTPPSVPTKKPSIAVKKSPSGSSSSGGLFSGIKKKIVDVVDGATSSKSSFSPTAKVESAESSENVFDQVERISMLTDVRATRPKAPAGRRPPSMVFKEEEPPIPNGNAPVEPLNLEIVSEISNSSDADASEVKPKLREWEKHKAPWLAEMKLNQAKRTSPSPGPPENRPRFTSGENKEEEAVKPEVKTTKPESEMSKSLTAISTTTPLTSKVKDVEKVPLRPKPNLPNIPPTQRPASMQSVSPVIPSPEITQKPPTPSHVKSSPVVPKTSHSPSLHRIEKGVNDLKSFDQDVTISFKQYTELVERIHKLELLVEKQNVIHMAAIDELKGKLQLETELRHMLQVQLEKVASQNLMQESRETSQSAKESGASDRRTLPFARYRELHLYNILFIIVTIIGMITMFLTYFWGAKYCKGYSLDTVWTEVNWHPLLMVVGFTFLYAQAFLFDQTGKNLPRWCGTFIPNNDIFWFILVIKVVCFIMVVLGLQVAFDFGNFFKPPKPHVFTLHAWLGIGSVILLSLDILLDFKWFFLDKISDLKRDILIMLSWMVRTMTFVTSINSSITGFMEDAIFMYRTTYADLPAAAVFLNVIGLLVLLFGVIVLHLSRKMREIGNLGNISRNVEILQ